MAHAIQSSGRSHEAEAPQAAAESVAVKAQSQKQTPQDSVQISSAGQAASAKSQTSETPSEQ